MFHDLAIGVSAIKDIDVASMFQRVNTSLMDHKCPNKDGVTETVINILNVKLHSQLPLGHGQLLFDRAWAFVLCFFLCVYGWVIDFSVNCGCLLRL